MESLTVFKFAMRVYFVVENSYSITSAHKYFRLNLSRQCHLIDYICHVIYLSWHRGYDCMVVGLTTSYAIRAYHN